MKRIYVSVENQRGSMEVVPCKYSFGCRQVVLSDERSAKSFVLKANPDGNSVRLETSVSSKIALVSLLRGSAIIALVMRSLFRNKFENLLPFLSFLPVRFPLQLFQRMNGLWNGSVPVSFAVGRESRAFHLPIGRQMAP